MLTAAVEYRVPYADTDQMGFVYYANYLVYFERSRNELMRAAGFTYKRLEELGLGLPVIETKVNYHRPAKYDDVLRIEAACEFKGGIRLQVDCKVFCVDVLLVEGYTIHAFMDLKTGRPARPCKELTDALGEGNMEAENEKG